jgi:hypothetical protein
MPENIPVATSWLLHKSDELSASSMPPPRPCTCSCRQKSFWPEKYPPLPTALLWTGRSYKRTGEAHHGDTSELWHAPVEARNGRSFPSPRYIRLLSGSTTTAHHSPRRRRARPTARSPDLETLLLPPRWSHGRTAAAQPPLAAALEPWMALPPPSRRSQAPPERRRARLCSSEPRSRPS